MQHHGKKVSISNGPNQSTDTAAQRNASLYYCFSYQPFITLPGPPNLDLKRYRMNAKSKQTSNIEHKNWCTLRVPPTFFVGNCNTKLHFYLQHIIRRKVNVVAKAFLKVRSTEIESKKISIR